MSKSFLQRLGITEDDKKQPEPAASQTSQPARTALVTSVAPPTGDAPVAPADSTLDIDAVKAGIESAIHSTAEFAPVANFLGIVADTKDVPGMDEATRFRAAQKLTKTPVADLQAALATHTTVLANETKRFEEVFVNVAHAEVVSLSEKADAVGIEIESVQTHLNELLAQKAKLIEDATARNTNLEKAKIDFSQIMKDTAARYAELGVKLTKHLGA
jgi:hypothetical protein